MIRAIFPGDRRVWLGSLAALVPLLGLVVYELVLPRQYYTGTDSQGVRSVVATVPPRDVLCVPNIDIPDGTGEIQLPYATATNMSSLRVTVAIGRRIVARGAATPLLSVPVITRVSVELHPVVRVDHSAAGGTVCLHTGSGAPMVIGGFNGLPTDATPPTIGGKPIRVGIPLWFLPPHAKRRSLIDSWPAIADRLALFRPGFAGTTWYWLLFLLGLPALSYAGLRALAVAERPGGRLALTLGIIAVANAGVWAITTTPFDAPDESEHFAYVETLAETGRVPASTTDHRSVYATDQQFALDAIHHFSTIEIGDTRPPWFSRDQALYQRRLHSEHPSRADGGGYAESTHEHAPLYYALLVPAYALSRSDETFTQLFWMRMTSALLGMIVVLAAYGTMRELVPSRAELAVAAALLIAFEPMFGFIAGAVNNDNGVNAFAALTVYLVVRALRRGLTWRLGAALGVTAALLPVMKATGLALLPAVGVALAIIAVRRRSWSTLASIGAAAGSFAAISLIWSSLAGLFHRGTPASGTARAVVGSSASSLGGKLVYLWEMFLPRLPFMAEHWQPGTWPFMLIYIQRGFAAFGWYAVLFPFWVYRTIAILMGILGLLALAMAVRLRRQVLHRWAEGLFLILVICGVISGVEFANYSPIPRIPIDLFSPEQGRYAFTAIVPLSALAVAGLLLLPRRHSRPLAAMLVAAMICLSLASHLLYVAANFS